MSRMGLAATVLLAANPAAAEALWPLADAEPIVMNTISTLQFYGETPGFHHGLDLAAPAGTTVVAPVSGRVETGHYYKRVSDYTYEVAIVTVGGDRWELHHIDPDDVPPEIEDLAAQGGVVEAGATVGRIYDAAEIGIEPHLHINVLGPDGIYRDPISELPSMGDDQGPDLVAYWWARRNGAELVEVVDGSAPDHLVLEAHDPAPGGLQRQSVHRMDVTMTNQRLFHFDFDRLPAPSFLDGVDHVYFLGDLRTATGDVLRSDPEERRFLYDVVLPKASGDVKVSLEDASGNSTKVSVHPRDR